MKRTLPPVLVIAAMVVVYVIMHGQLGFTDLFTPGGKKHVLPDTGKKVTLTFVQWPGAIAAVNVVKVVLHRKLGFTVDIKPVQTAFMWQAVALGTADGFLAAWLPTLHRVYYEKYKDHLVDLGPNLDHTRNGLVVPDYMHLSSITQLNKHADELSHRIYGIGPGAGIMLATAKAIKAYHLNYKLVASSSASMAAQLGRAIQQKKPIVVTGWTPYWIFARWHLHYLKDPKKVYGNGGHINTFVRQGLKKDLPDAYYVLDHFHWKIDALRQVMGWNRKKDSSPLKSAQRWIRENPKKVAAWLPKSAEKTR